MTESIIEELSERLGNLLLERELMLVTAESCTGGGLAEIITRIPGSSNWFERGFVTYSNEAKQELLGVSLNTIEQSGAVSEETAIAMAEGAIDNSHADVSISITGIAGPDGGTEDKPVGTVCFAWSGREMETHTARTVFKGDRSEVRLQACMMALQGLIDRIEV